MENNANVNVNANGQAQQMANAIPMTQPAPTQKKIYEKPLFWVGVGIGVVAIGGLALYLIGANSGADAAIDATVTTVG